MDDVPLDAETYRELLLLSRDDLICLYSTESLIEWLEDHGWECSVEVERRHRDDDAPVNVAHKGSTYIRGLGGPMALHDIADVENLTITHVQVAVIEHQGGPKWPDWMSKPTDKYEV
ncbi:MAG: hypothetical protein ABEN55_20395 [Bradymonadaceae bacterium]